MTADHLDRVIHCPVPLLGLVLPHQPMGLPGAQNTFPVLGAEGGFGEVDGGEEFGNYPWNIVNHWVCIRMDSQILACGLEERNKILPKGSINRESKY